MDVGYLYSAIHNLHFKMNTGERNIDPMSDLDKLDPNLKRQYVGAYGDFYPGDYPIGSQIPGEGEVLWSYLSAARGVVYVVDGPFPAEVAANEIRQSK